MSWYRRTTAKISKTTRVVIELLGTILGAYRQLRLSSSRLATGGVGYHRSQQTNEYVIIYVLPDQRTIATVTVPAVLF